jgi:hypothetical protein
MVPGDIDRTMDKEKAALWKRSYLCRVLGFSRPVDRGGVRMTPATAARTKPGIVWAGHVPMLFKPETLLD